MSKSPHYDLLTRTLVNGFSAVLIAFFIFIAEYPVLSWVFTAAVCAIACVSFWEYMQIVRKLHFAPSLVLGILFSVLYIFAAYFKTWQWNENWQPFFVYLPASLLALLIFCCFVYFAKIGSPIVNISTTFFGVVYIAVPLSLLVRTMYFFSPDLHFQGSFWVAYLIAVTKSADMGGYFIGRSFGYHKLASRLSPNKTLEGALGGVIVAIGVSYLMVFLGKWTTGAFAQVSYFIPLWLGALLGIFGSLGDLAESLLKRDAQVKDSNTIPAVGGILDMIDSLLFTTPILYIFLILFYT